ncbi:MAG: efflux RND transporter permease subunit [Duncaniella sp.]|nr:efflux RND transporter permease subunit [Duncaniella sp.]
MTRFTEFFMRRSTLFWSAMVMILLAGVLFFTRMPKLEDPAVVPKQASVMILYPGADAETIERDAVTLLEDRLRTLPDVKKIKSDVRAGQALISVEFEFDVPVEEIEQYFDQVRRKVSDSRSLLPQGCMDPIVIDDMMDVYGIFYSLSGDGYETAEIEKFAKKMRREIMGIKGVKRVNIGGVQRDVIDIAFTPDAIRRNGMLPMLVAQTLQSSTKVINAGKIDNGDDRIAVSVEEGAVTAEEISSLIVTMPDGKKVRIGDIAAVSRHEATPLSGDFYVGGETSLTLLVALESSAVVPAVGAEVDKVMNREISALPAGITVKKIFFQPERVDTAISSFMINLLESIAIVFIVILLAMGWKAGLIIGFGLILTVALSFPILSVAGTTLQRISLGAFIVAMGMLVDNAVVIMDGIINDRKRGLRKDVYLYSTVRKTAWPLLGATIIAAATFLPIYMTPGTVGEFAGDLFLVICVSLLASWILAMVQVPVCSDRWLSPAEAASVKPGELKLNFLQRMIRRAVIFLIDHKWVSVASAVVILGVSLWGMTVVRNVFFPDFDYDQFVVECTYPIESNPDAIRERMFMLTDSIEAWDGVESVAISMGGAPGRYCLVRPMPSAGEEYAEFIIDCRDFKTVRRLSADLVAHLRQIVPDAYIRARRYNLSISSSHTVEVEFAGPDADTLRALSAQAEAIMRACPYVDPLSVQNNWLGRRRGVSLAYSPGAASAAGVNRADIGNAMMAATDGYTIGVVNDRDKTVPINLIIRDNDGNRLADLSTLPVWSTINVSVTDEDVSGLMSGAVSPDDITERMYTTTVLSAVVDSIHTSWRESVIHRLNGRRVIEAECDPVITDPSATPAKILEAIGPELKQIRLPEGYSMRFVGESETSDEAVGIMMSYLPLMVGIVVIVLLLLFNDWRKLAVILLCFPFVLCGIVPALLITDTPFTFLAILGLMGLMGMTIKNAIVLVDEIARLTTEEKVELYPAIVRATVSRVMPVILASFTTIAGMIPLIPDPMYGSLAVTIIGGLFVGTLATLLLLPTLYSVFFKVTRK